MEWIEKILAARQREDLLRELSPVSSIRDGKVRINDRWYFNFSGNDYLGLAGHPELVAAAKAALDEWGAGASASRLLSGDREIFHRLEKEIAQLQGKERALVFNSGYQANVGMIGSFVGRNDVVFSDRLNHASIIDGIVLSRAAFFRFRHNDCEHLHFLLRKQRKKFNRALIVTETVFSMEGDRPPLRELVNLKEKYDCLLMVDEAHAVGIFGKDGAGVVEEEELGENVDLIMGTFGKALGSFGAYLAGSESVVRYLHNFCRSFIYSTALPPPVIAASLAALELLRREPQRRKELREKADSFRESLKEKGLEVRGCSQIVPLIVGETRRVLELSERLRERGFWARALRPPTVPANESRIRFSLTFHHSDECLNDLKKSIFELL